MYTVLYAFKIHCISLVCYGKAFRQDPGATSEKADWFHIHPNGSKIPVATSLWKEGHPHDNISTTTENGEKDYGAIWLVPFSFFKIIVSTFYLWTTTRFIK